jgi:type II secretory pathway component PulM
MLPVNHNLVEVARQQHEEYRRAAQKEQLARQLDSRPARHQAIMVKLGVLLVSVGRRLQAPAAQTQACAEQVS